MNAPHDAQTTLRMPRALLDQLKDRWAASFDQHRLSFNAWLIEILEENTK